MEVIKSILFVFLYVLKQKKEKKREKTRKNNEKMEKSAYLNLKITQKHLKSNKKFAIV